MIEKLESDRKLLEEIRSDLEYAKATNDDLLIQTLRAVAIEMEGSIQARETVLAREAKRGAGGEVTLDPLEKARRALSIAGLDGAPGVGASGAESVAPGHDPEAEAEAKLRYEELRDRGFTSSEARVALGDGACGRLMLGSGGDSFDPICELSAGHEGSCKSSAAVDQHGIDNYADEQLDAIRAAIADVKGAYTASGGVNETLMEEIAALVEQERLREQEIREERMDDSEDDEPAVVEDDKPNRLPVRFVDASMFTAETMPQDAMDRPRGYLLSATPDPLGAIAAYAMMYEGRVIRHLREITDEERVSYFKDCFKTALQTPLEAFDLHFMVEGITRASWDQMVRQRTAAFAGESLRFAVKDQTLTDVVRSGPMVTGPNEAIWTEAVEGIESAYHRLIANGVPAEDARGLLPLNVLVRGHWKTNFRNFYAEVGKRLCTAAQFEWRLIHADLRRAIGEYVPYVPGMTDAAGLERANWQFAHIAASDVFKPICFQKGACMFKAKADRGCTIRGRVDEGRFKDIDPAEWLLDPTAAHVTDTNPRPS